jgi:hypothetical protein
MSRPIGKCRLCEQTAELCRSHIVPDFCRMPILNDKKQVIEYCPATGKKSKKQTQRRERLLCSDCELLLSKYEATFKRNWMDTIPSQFADSDTVVFKMDDYDQYKLFHLSILWRAAVAGYTDGRPASLGPYEDVLRKMILTGDAGKDGDFFIYGQILVDENRCPRTVITPLVKSRGRVDGHQTRVMQYAFAEWEFVIGTPCSPRLQQGDREFREKGAVTLEIIHFSAAKMTGYIADVLRKRISR